MTAPRPPTDPDQLLKWSIAASGADESVAPEQNEASIQRIAGDIASGKRPDLADPGLYDALMGKSEGQMMREELTVALDTSRSTVDRVQALDNFEMLIESIDNANNMTTMKMWQPLMSLLDVGSAQQPPEIQLAALWIVGTAVQNNDKAQMAVLDYDPLPSILHLLAHGADGRVRSKAMYALSGIVKHNAKAVQLFTEQDGWTALRGALLDPDVSLRRKAAFLVNTLLLQDGSAAEGQAAAAAVSSATNAPSRATAVAPVAPSAADELPSAPLEQPPATLRDGTPHPAIAPLLLASQLLSTLVVSLLPSADVPDDDAAMLLAGAAAAAGPDGDIELRDDVDYAEKAARACLTFVEKVDASPTTALRGVEDDKRTQAKTLLQALVREVQGRPVDVDVPASMTSRWQELGWDADELGTFQRGVELM